MANYVGLDIGLESTAVCIMDQEGEILQESMVPSDPDAIVQHLSEAGLTFKRIGMEACPLSQWLFDGLVKAGFPAVCVEIRHLKAAMSAMTHKSDRNDARGIAHVMRTGWFRSVHVKSRMSQEARMLLTSRRLLVKKRGALESELRGSLKVFGLKIGKVTRKAFAQRALELVTDQPALLAIVEPLLKLRAEVVKQLNVLDRMVHKAAREDEICRRWMAIPVVGPVVALTFRSAIDVPERFVKSRSVGPVLGLVPKKYQSGEVNRHGRITKRGDEMTRSMLYEAANVMLIRGRFCSLKAWALKIRQQRGFKRAKVALARKLAVVMHAMWVDGSEFRWGAAAAA
ncbi:MAG: IS110 family transposase [Geminicoccaceae bacterium]